MLFSKVYCDSKMNSRKIQVMPAKTTKNERVNQYPCGGITKRYLQQSLNYNVNKHQKNPQLTSLNPEKINQISEPLDQVSTNPLPTSYQTSTSS
jgi:hypothetical protein